MALVLLALLVAGCGGESQRVIVAAGTTLVDSGFVDEVVATYKADHPDIQVSVIGESTAQVLELGRSGGAEVLLVHAPQLEEEFVAEGESLSREPVFESRFLLVGPPDQAERYSDLSFSQAFAALANDGQPFVSRSDGSGTHLAELGLWNQAARSPVGEDWYIETGQGMGLTLQVADQREAFVLAEEGAYLAAVGTLDLAVVDTSDRLTNPYSVIVVNDGSRAAVDLAVWLTSAAGADAVEAANDRLFGQLVYRP